MSIDLKRFKEGYERDFEKAFKEVSNGIKETHWMWYIFPQIKGLGSSEMARFYSINDLDEARAFLNDSYLSENLNKICRALLEQETDNPQEIFGYIDSLKLCSSMTLFGEVAKDNTVFSEVLDKYFNGKKDPKTLSIIEFNHFK